MTQDHTPVGDAAESEVMAAVDDAATGHSSYVIADICCDGAWLSVHESDAVVLSEWC